MRMMLRVNIPVAAGNRAVADGTVMRVVQETMQRISPEAAYFGLTGGNRSMFFVFDMTDSSQLPPLLEPLFAGLDATVDLTPIMNGEDIQKGVAQL